MKFVVKIDESFCNNLFLHKEDGENRVYRIPSKAKIKLFPEVKVRRVPLETGMVAFVRFDKEPFQRLISIQAERDVVRIYPLFEVRKKPTFSLHIFKEEEFMTLKHCQEVTVIYSIIGTGLNDKKEINQKAILAVVEKKNE